MKKVFVLLGCHLLLAACVPISPLIWTKPDASQDDFARDRYSCLQQSQQPASAAYVNQYAGSAQSGVVTNEQLLGACMNANGWYLQRADQVQAQAAQAAAIARSNLQAPDAARARAELEQQRAAAAAAAAQGIDPARYAAARQRCLARVPPGEESMYDTLTAEDVIRSEQIASH